MDIQSFQDHPVTRGFTPAELQQLAGLLVEQQIASGQKLCSEGHPSPGLFLVPTGRVCVSKLDSEGDPQTLARLDGPTVLGELEFVSGTACSATVTALEDITVYVLQASALERLVANGAVTVAKMLRNIACQVVLRLQALNERYVDAAKGWGSVFHED